MYEYDWQFHALAFISIFLSTMLKNDNLIADIFVKIDVKH